MNKTIRIGIDIDGTLTEPDFWVEPLNKHFNQQLKYGDSDEYDWLQIYQLEPEEFMSFYKTHGPAMHLNAAIRPGAAATIKQWHCDHQIYYLTARQSWLTATTEQWLQIHELPGDCYVLGSHYKLQKAQDLQCELFIEDNYEVACQLAEGGIRVLLLDCSYNRKPLPSRLISRVYNWQDIAQEVKRIAGD